MGSVVLGHHRDDLVADIERVIHHPEQLHSMIREAKVSLDHTGLLPNDRTWNYLRWRRDLDNKRFDHYHPEFLSLFLREGADLERAHDATSLSTLTVGSTSPLLGVPSGMTRVQPSQDQPSGGSIQAASVPEPSSVLIFGLGVATAFAASKLTGRRASR